MILVFLSPCRELSEVAENRQEKLINNVSRLPISGGQGAKSSYTPRQAFSAHLEWVCFEVAFPSIAWGQLAILRENWIRESFCESEEGVRLPRGKGWPPGKSGGTSGEVRETSGEVWETSGEPLGLLFSSTVIENFRWSRRKLPGKFGELPGKSGDFPEARGSLTPSQWLAKFVSN